MRALDNFSVWAKQHLATMPVTPLSIMTFLTAVMALTCGGCVALCALTFVAALASFFGLIVVGITAAFVCFWTGVGSLLALAAACTLGSMTATLYVATAVGSLFVRVLTPVISSPLRVMSTLELPLGVSSVTQPTALALLECLRPAGKPRLVPPQPPPFSTADATVTVSKPAAKAPTTVAAAAPTAAATTVDPATASPDAADTPPPLPAPLPASAASAAHDPPLTAAGKPLLPVSVPRPAATAGKWISNQQLQQHTPAVAQRPPQHPTSERRTSGPKDVAAPVHQTLQQQHPQQQRQRAASDGGSPANARSSTLGSIFTNGLSFLKKRGEDGGSAGTGGGGDSEGEQHPRSPSATSDAGSNFSASTANSQPPVAAATGAATGAAPLQARRLRGSRKGRSSAGGGGDLEQQPALEGWGAATGGMIM